MNEFVVRKEVKAGIQKYFLLRGINQSFNSKVVVSEKEFKNKPTDEEIAIFLFESNCSFASVEENYRLTIPMQLDLPF